MTYTNQIIYILGMEDKGGTYTYPLRIQSRESIKEELESLMRSGTGSERSELFKRMDSGLVKAVNRCEYRDGKIHSEPVDMKLIREVVEQFKK